MSDAIDPRILEVSQYLASLPQEERLAEQKKLRHLIVTQLPEDELEEKPPIRSLGEYLDREIELPPILVAPGLVARGAITSMTSRGGKGKTAVSLNRLIRWSMELPLFPELPDLMKPTSPLRSLIIENEGAPGHFQKVMQTILHGNDFAPEQIDMARENVTIWGDGGWSGLKLDNEENFELVNKAAGICKPDIIFIEPFRGLWKGDENSSQEMANLLDKFSELAHNHNCAVLVTHHERKSGADGGDPMSAARGSGVMEGAAAVMEQWKPVKGGKLRELSWIKARFDEAPVPVRMEFDRESWSYRYVSDNEGVREVLTVLQNYEESWLEIKEVAEDLEETYDKTRRLLNKAVEEEQAVRKRQGDGKVRYRIKNGGNESDGLDI